jgi:hypothetical protein
MIFAGEIEVLGENLPSATLSTTNPTWIDPGLHGERPTTNRLSHGTASLSTTFFKYDSALVYSLYSFKPFKFKTVGKKC